MAVGAITLALFMFLSHNQKTLSYSDFLQLLNVTQYKEPGSGKLDDDFLHKSRLVVNRNDTQIEYSLPSELKIGEGKIQGKLMYRVASGKGQSDKPTKVKFVVYKDKSDSTTKDLIARLNASNMRWEQMPDTKFWDTLGFFLLPMLLIFVVFFFMLRRLGGSGGPMQFGRSRGRLYAEEDLGVTFGDVAGIDEAVEEVKEVVDFLKNPEKYQKLGGKIPCGVLLVGPPGTGKTLLAKAIAGEAGVPFFSLSGSDFVEMFVGVGAARVRDMFPAGRSESSLHYFYRRTGCAWKNTRWQRCGWARRTGTNTQCVTGPRWTDFHPTVV